MCVGSDDLLANRSVRFVCVYTIVYIGTRLGVQCAKIWCGYVDAA